MVLFSSISEYSGDFSLMWRTPGSVRLPDNWVPLELLISLFCPHWAATVNQLQFRFLDPGTSFHWGFRFWVCAVVSCDFQYLPFEVSNFKDSNLPSDLSSLKSLRSIVDFIVNHIFYVLRVEWQLPSFFFAKLEAGSPGLVVFGLGLVKGTWYSRKPCNSSLELNYFCSLTYMRLFCSEEVVDMGGIQKIVVPSPWTFTCTFDPHINEIS